MARTRRPGKNVSRGKVVSEAKTLETLRKKRQLRRGRNLLLLLLFAGMFALGFNRVAAYEGDITRATFTITGPIAVPVLEMRPVGGETGLVAVVAHGFAGSKELMSSFGVELARAGITAYLFDFPGHGESPATLVGTSYSQASAAQNLAALGEVVSYARTHNSATPTPKIVLLGHSMGSAAVGDYAMAQPANELAATILVSPVGQEEPTKTQPQNLLMLVGQNDLPFAVDNSARLLRSGCGLGDAQAAPEECGNPASGTGRRAVVLSGLNHITILNASSTFVEMLAWLKSTDPGAVQTQNMDANTRLAWLLVGLAGILLAIFPLGALIIDMSDVNSTPRALRGQDVLYAYLCVVGGISAAIAIQYAWRPFSFLHLLLADYVSGYFFFTALITAGLILVVRRMVPLPLPRQVIRQIFIGIALWVILYFTLGQLATFAWERFTLTLPRLWRMGVIFLLILPLFLLDEGISRGYQEQGMLRAILASFGFKLLLIVGLAASVFLTPGLGFLSIVLPVLALLFVLLTAWGTSLYGSGRAAITGATLSALMVAWSMAAIFPITGG